MTVYTHLEGSVEAVHWLNPHSWVYVKVTGENGESEMWALEAAAPWQLVRNGVTRYLIKSGDTISARCHQLLDGSNGCLLGYLKGPDGIERLWD